MIQGRDDFFQVPQNTPDRYID